MGWLYSLCCPLPPTSEKRRFYNQRVEVCIIKMVKENTFMEWKVVYCTTTLPIEPMNSTEVTVVPAGLYRRGPDHFQADHKILLLGVRQLQTG